LAARLRQTGYEVYQAAQLTYRLSVSGEQDTGRKRLRHQRLFGRAHPYIVGQGSARNTRGARKACGQKPPRLPLRLQRVGSSGVLGLALESAALSRTSGRSARIVRLSCTDEHLFASRPTETDQKRLGEAEGPSHETRVPC
jgi:hypothetical protein